MTSKHVASLLADLGVTKTHSRPHVSNDNPFSEAQVKTMKYCPGFPERFGSIVDARGFSADFLPGTTTSITTAGSTSSRQRTSTSAGPSSGSLLEPASLLLPSRHALSASSAVAPTPVPCRTPRG